MPKSLRRQLLSWVLVPLALTGALDTWLTYQSAVTTASVVQDRLLLGSARMIAEQIRFEDGTFEHQIPPAALELFQSEGVDRIYYRVTTGDGRLLSGYSDLPLSGGIALQGSPYFENLKMRNQEVRMVGLAQPVVGSPASKPVWVQIAQTTHEHQQLVSNLWWQEVEQQVLILLLTGALILWGIHQGIRGLLQFRDAVHAQREGALIPIPIANIPGELIPVATALNDYIARLNRSLNQRNSYLQNAAHQLRTPLTVLATQLSDAGISQSQEQLTRALANAKRTLQQTSHVVNQYLMLSSAESFAIHLHLMTIQSFTIVVQEVLEDFAVNAHRKSIDLGLDVKRTEGSVLADATAVREILRNLVDNAIRYTPERGIVTVCLDSLTPKSIQLCVEDNGPGIPESYRELAFDRFTRIDTSERDGSGLGLAIVKELVDQCGAHITLEASKLGETGLCVAIDFS